jgi:hypothetical protein
VDRGFESQQGQNIFLFSKMSRTALGPIPSSLPCSFLGVKRPGREVDYSPSSSAEVMNEWSYYLNSLYVPSWHKHEHIYLFCGKIIAKCILSIKYLIFLKMFPKNIFLFDKM